MLPRFILYLALAAAPLAAQSPIRVQVDATEAPVRIFHVAMTIPVTPGPLTLMYPEWIPGDHSPDGPIAQMVGLTARGGGSLIAWHRDDVDMFAHHLEIPSGVTTLDVRFDYLSPPDASGGEFASGSSATTELMVLNWNQVLLYPKGVDPDTLPFQASLRLPAGWKYGTALPVASEADGALEFKPCSLTTLIDSPLSAGSHYRTIDLGAEGGRQHYLHLAADSDRALEIEPATVTAYRRLVGETGVLFGARHYRDYHFLLSLSDHIAHFGLEHHESSDDRIGERALVDEAPRVVEAPLLPHEFVHSWNGKYRRPASLAPSGHDGGYDLPMKGDLLWVYEGLTEYLDEILTPRSGLWTPQQFRDSLALTAAQLDSEYGRRWRPLSDTAVAAQILYVAGDDYANYRRGVDFYPEGILIWLDADVTIRRLSRGARSLDDFCRAFYGPPSSGPALKTFGLADLVSALNAVQPYDWAAFFQQRLESTAPHAPLAGIENGGWKLVYDDARSEFFGDYEANGRLIDLSFSVGMKVKDDDGTIIDVVYGGPAQKAGVSPSVKLIAVNGRQFTPPVLRQAVKSTASGKPLELLIKTGEYYETHRIDYHSGERYPHLAPESGKTDLLGKIIEPLAKR